MISAGTSSYLIKSISNCYQLTLHFIYNPGLWYIDIWGFNPEILRASYKIST